MHNNLALGISYLLSDLHITSSDVAKCTLFIMLLSLILPANILSRALFAHW